MGFKDHVVWRFFRRYWKLIIIIGGPLILIPIATEINVPRTELGAKWVSGSKASADVMIGEFAYVLALMALFWMTEVIPVSATAFIPMILFPLLGIMKAKDVAGQYMKDIIMLFVGGLMFAVAIEKTNLHRRIALCFLRLVGTSPRTLMAALQAVTWFLSMWISNTATTAMMMPIAEAIFKQLEEYEIRSTGADRATYRNSAKLKRMFVGMTLAIPHSANIGGMATITGTPPNLVMTQNLHDKFPLHQPEMDFGRWMGFAFPQSLLYMILAYIWLSSMYIGWTDVICGRKDESVRARAKAETEAINAAIEHEYQKLSPMKNNLGECIVGIMFPILVLLWFFRNPAFTGWGSWFKSGYVSDSTTALTISCLMFLLPLHWPKFGLNGKPTKPILEWDDIETMFPWGVIILIGGGYSLSKASSDSGFSDLVAARLAVLKDMHPLGIILILTIITGFATEFTSNTATEHLLVEIVANLSVAIEVNPYMLLMPMTLATSLAFMLPVATPPNAIAFSYKRITIKDMCTSGIVMNLVGFILVAFFVWWYGRVSTLLDIDPWGGLPDWANATNRAF